MGSGAFFYLPDNSWSGTSTASPRTSKCINHIKLSRIIHLRGYLTPVRLAHVSSPSPLLDCAGDPVSSPACYYICGGPVLLLPLFWKEVENLITEISGLRLTHAPDLAILDLNLDDIPNPIRTVIHHIFLAARMSIGRMWENPKYSLLCRVD